ncbi:hypothetical protein J8G26_09040 [Acidovorax sp. JG5]|uniref:phage tail tube protein n=1 Tax=Acidovorax sp. JG5 TaxID=2822718 RepID=UPI001B33FE78|nr:hypothetical protein [Acidovorax sp. JG5]MBP3980872.1 hypothetical protein [Acidovorax sp. JG5]
MPIQHVKNEYLIPRGRVYFDPFDANEQLTGEIALGNCPGITLSISTEKSDHFSSETGLRQKDGSWVIQVDRTGTVNCDNFSPSNAALWLSGTLEKKTQAATPVTGELRNVIPGRQYQLGATAANPLGVRNVSVVTVKDEAGTATYIAGTDYNLDLETGRVQIIEGGAIVAGKVQFGYTPVAASFESVKSGGKSELQGALRVVSDNATGGNRDWYLPKVTLTPSGDLALIAEGTDVVAMEFGLEALKPANGEAIYCDGRPVVV